MRIRRLSAVAIAHSLPSPRAVATTTPVDSGRRREAPTPTPRRAAGDDRGRRGEPFPDARCDANEEAGTITYLTGFDYAAPPRSSM